MRKAESDPVAAGLRQAREFHKSGDRGAEFRALLDLREACADKVENAIELADAFMRIGENSAVVEFFTVYKTRIASPQYTELYLVWCAPFAKRFESKERLGRLLEKSDKSFDFCIKLARAAGQICGADAALIAAKQALDCARSADEILRARYQIAHLHFIAHRPQHALDEMKSLQISQIASSLHGQRYAQLAFKCRDKDFGIEISRRLLDLPSANFGVMLGICTILAEGGERTEAVDVIEKLFVHAKNATLTRDQYAELIAAARPLGFEPEQRAISLAMHAYPDDETFPHLAAARESADRDEFAAKFPDTDRPPRAHRQSFFARFRSRFGA